MKIIEYQESYRDDLIFMILEAKDALDRIPSINPDLLTIQSYYLDKGDNFWLGIDAQNRVIGSIAYSSVSNSSEVFLHRLFVKPRLKNQGLGSQLLCFAEKYLIAKGKTAIQVHLGQPKEDWIASYSFYPKHGYIFYDDTHLIKIL
ncbi:GNAT family N-acetyltransferase [Streptococcus sp. S784/96/1]|uniref:GNAT family N-acetyltransferase n=1 Tax=Streptococcus sp. S784/96/1 TaxID=2653499 RepID=UPI001389816D|nr:GNAT family N-acetyltransferase [Streptococcus sp. S784/96/1]